MKSTAQSNTEHNTRTHMSTREQFAQQGINYDKATRRILAAHTDQHTRPTLRMAKAALNVLLPLTVALLLGACSGVPEAYVGINGLPEGTCCYSTDSSFQQPTPDCVTNFAGGWNCPTSCDDPRAGRTYGVDAADAG
jgi:hypothetical protein